MNGRKLLPAALLLILLPGCAPDDPARAALDTVRSLPPVERRAAIKRTLARVCPVPLTDSELERAAVYVELNAASLESQWLVGRLDRMDAETRVCRGQKQ